jgi:hypothetical protein
MEVTDCDKNSGSKSRILMASQPNLYSFTTLIDVNFGKSINFCKTQVTNNSNCKI